MNRLYDRILLLKQSTFFGDIDTEDLKQVAQAMREEPFCRGDVVFQAGDQGDTLYVIETGRVAICLPVVEGGAATSASTTLCELGRGDCFGEMNLLDEKPRSATAEVLEDSLLLALDKARLHGLLASYPALALGMLKNLSLRLRKANARARAVIPGYEELP